MQNNPIKILTDEEEDQPILGFRPLGRCITNMIIGSSPRFSVGIYGEWGTGKTTLMRIIERELTEYQPKVLIVWFNAWRYEREDNLAITALLKTIAYAMKDHPIYGELKPIILRSIKIITKGMLSEVASKLISREAVTEIKDGLENRSLPYLDLLAEIDKDTIYFDGLHKIEEEMAKILKNPKYEFSRIVVFIDDLDRCSPKRALEVFESVKVFLDIEGFVFVIGLSHDSISRLMDAEYRDSKIIGRQYIKKIIQVPVILPEWKKKDVYEIIDSLTRSGRLSSDYSQLINENKSVLGIAVEPNPREVKRFINNFIMSNELFSEQLGKSILKEVLVIVQAIRFRWNDFYKQFTSDEKLREMLRLFLDCRTPFEDFITLIKGEDPINEAYSRMVKAEQALRSRPIDDVDDLLLSFKKNYFPNLELDKDLWEFLIKQSDKIYSIRNWEDYRAAADFSKEVPIPKNMMKDASEDKEVP